MDPLSSILGPWGQFGIIGSVVVTLGVAVVFLFRRYEALQVRFDSLHEARRLDAKECGERYFDMLTRKFETDNKMADGMEAFERVVDKVVKPT